MEPTPSQNPLEGRLVEGQKAADYFDTQGKLSGIFSGRKTTRLVLTSLSGERFKLAAKAANGQQEKLENGTVVKQRGSSYVVISVKEGDTTKKALLNINSAAKRLHLTPDQVMAFAKGEHRESVQTVAKSYAQFDTIIAQYEQSWLPFATAKAKNTGEDSPLSMRTLRKTLAVALTTPLASGIHLIRQGDADLFIKKGDEGTIQDISIRSSQVLGEGGFGTVTRLFSLTTAKLGEALKTPASSLTSSEARDAMTKGQAVLQAIHKDGDVPGVQKAPHLVTAHVRNPRTGETNPKTVVASISPAFEGDLRSGFFKPEINSDAPEIASPPLTKTTVQDRTKGCQTLLQGLTAIHAKDIVHGDIKPNNVLYKNTASGLELELIDFDGARFLKRSKGEQGRNPSLDVNSKDPFGIHTSGYLSSTDLSKTEVAQKSKDQTKFNELQKKRDVFAMGITCFELLTNGTRAFIRTRDGQITRFTPEDYRAVLLQAGVSAQAAEVVVDMLNKDPDQRPDAAACLQRLNSAIEADTARAKTT